MNPALVHLLFVIAGVFVALGALWYFARIRGGWSHPCGILTIVIVALGALLVLVGFGVVPFPGLESVR